VVHGDFHRHKHERDDEFFYVVDGRFVPRGAGADGVAVRGDQR